MSFSPERAAEQPESGMLQNLEPLFNKKNVIRAHTIVAISNALNLARLNVSDNIIGMACQRVIPETLVFDVFHALPSMLSLQFV